MARTVKRAYPSIRAWRHATGTRQADLAKRVGVTASHLANIELKTRACSMKVALALSRITNVPVELIAPADHVLFADSGK